MQVCFFCGSANGPEAKICHSCSQPLAGGEEEVEVEEQAAPTESPSECPFCGHDVEPDATECPHCRSAIVPTDPLDRPAPRTHERDITSRYDEFAAKVQLIREGQMSREQFSNWLGYIKGTLVGQRERYIDLIKTSGYYEFGSDEVDMGMTGILDFEEAMEMMSSYATNGADQSILDAALEKMWEGNQKCNEAMRINRDFRAKLEEDWGYM